MEGRTPVFWIKNRGLSPQYDFLFFEIIVVKVTNIEPFDKKIITNLGNKYNIYHRLILLMKLDTQTYYNLRVILGLECN